MRNRPHCEAGAEASNSSPIAKSVWLKAKWEWRPGSLDFEIPPSLCDSSAVRAVALLGPVAKKHHVLRFERPGVNLFSGNELDPTDQPDAALIFGGDGTIHRHLSGLAVKQIPTLVVPLGSANDCARSIGIETVEKALTAWTRFCDTGQNIRRIDIGTIRALEGPPKTDLADGSEEFAAWMKASANAPQDLSDIQRGVDARCGENFGSRPDARAANRVPRQDESLESLHFVSDGPRRDLPPMGASIMRSQLRHLNKAEREVARTTFYASIAGTGLDAAVNRLTLRQPRWLRAHGGYVVALLQVLGGFRPPHIRLSIEVEGCWKTRIDEPGFLIAVGNGPQYGHGMRLAHEAQMDDGLLDLCFVRPLSKLRLLRLFRVVYRGGHIGMKEVEYFRTSRVRIQTEPATEIFADGEYICKTPVEIAIRRNALRVIVAE